jgi:hypothetical protein
MPFGTLISAYTQPRFIPKARSVEQPEDKADTRIIPLMRSGKKPYAQNVVKSIGHFTTGKQYKSGIYLVVRSPFISGSIYDV